MAENFDIFDFELTDEDTGTIAKLDQRESLFFDPRDQYSPKSADRV